MPYKDKDKQRKAIKAAMQRLRAKNADSAKLSQKRGLENAPGCPTSHDLGDTQPVIPSNCDTDDYDGVAKQYDQFQESNQIGIASEV